MAKTKKDLNRVFSIPLGLTRKCIIGKLQPSDSYENEKDFIKRVDSRVIAELLESSFTPLFETSDTGFWENMHEGIRGKLENERRNKEK